MVKISDKRIVLTNEEFIKKYKDEPGTRHGNLVLLATEPIKAGEEVPIENSSKRNNIAPRTMYHCQCDCGNSTWINVSVWRNGYAKSCGKCFEPKPGKKYNSLTVIEEAPGKPREYPNGRVYMRRFWKCKCDCGKETIVSQDHLISGHTTSCGFCTKKKRDKIPEEYRSTMISIATGIISRCRDPHSNQFYNYGGRGIECKLGDTPVDVGMKLLQVEGYKPGLQIDRIDNNGHYELDNLHWVSPIENIANRVTSEEMTKDDVSLRPLTSTTFTAICNTNKFNTHDFMCIKLPDEILRLNPSTPELFLYIHDSNRGKLVYYVKRILGFWTRWSGTPYVITRNTGEHIVTPDGCDISLTEVISSDIN